MRLKKHDSIVNLSPTEGAKIFNIKEEEGVAQIRGEERVQATGINRISEGLRARHAQAWP